jgi:hypothetical protein
MLAPPGLSCKMYACTVLPVVLDTPLLATVSAGASLLGAVFVWLRTWGLLVRLRALEEAVDDNSRRTLSSQRRAAAAARWDGSAVDDAAIQAALEQSRAGQPGQQPKLLTQPWWRKHRGL